MRKYGKYEKRPEVTAPKAPKVKNELLQTYLTSLLSMVLCVTMFLGTSYAWFSSEVNNVGNEIYIGILDVDMEKQLADGTWESLADMENGVNKVQLFDNNVRWEPGFTTLETVKVINQGDLAFKYNLTFTDGKITNKAKAQLQEEAFEAVAKNFDIWVYDHRANDNAAPTATSYEQITAENSGWEFAGSLADALSGKSVLEGKMATVREDGLVEADINEFTTDGVATEDTYTVALHMREDAAAAVMGHKISLNVKLLAYQMSKEQDGFGANYDLMVATAEELSAAVQNGGTVALAADIELKDELITSPSDKNVVLDLNGHKITSEVEKNVSLITNEGNLIIQGDGEISIVFKGAVNNGKAVNAIANKGILTVNGGRISNTGLGNQIGYGIDNYNGATLTVNGGKIVASGSSSYDGIRLFCGSNETLVTVNGGEISTIWAQNPTTGKATEVKGAVVVNGGTIGTVYYENYTTVQVATEVVTTVTAYGAHNEKATSEVKEGYTVYSFAQG